MGEGATAELLPQSTTEYPRTRPHVDRDDALIAGLGRGDPRAAERLVEVYGARAYGLAIRITRSPQDAEEIVQDALLTVARSEEHTSELQSHVNLVCRLLLEKKKN